MFKGKLLRSGNNAKTVKGDDAYETAIMYLAPSTASGFGNVCPMAVIAQCKDPCLYLSGRGAFSNVQKARINKTKLYFQDRALFMDMLFADLEKFERYCARKGVKPAVRLNGTSDIQFERGHYVKGFDSVFDAFPNIKFYDYTKIAKRAYRQLPANYSITLSYSGANPEYAAEIMRAFEETDFNIAVVYRTKELRDEKMRSTWESEFDDIRIINGDRDDLRFLDERKVIVGLYAKGPAKTDQSGFVID